MDPQDTDRLAPAPIRDAASVVLIRDGARGLEAFTLTRATTMVFAAGATVFPGGGLDPSDTFPAGVWNDPAAAQETWARAFGEDDESTVARLLITAVRETFEESGVLLGLAPDSPLPSGEIREEARRALENHTISLWQVFTEHGLRADFSSLRPMARWITPEGRPRRYDTRFFLAPLPEGQEALHVTGEATEAGWMTPGQALELHDKGRTQLMRPTLAMFRTLSGFSSAAEALAAGPVSSAMQPGGR